MNTTFIQTVLDFLKLAPSYLSIFGIAAAFLLFTPDRIAQQLGVLEFAKHNRAALGLTVIAATSHLVVRHRNRVLQYLMQLTEDELDVLQPYVLQMTRSARYRPDDGVVRGLVRAGVLYQATALGHTSEGFAFNLTDVAWQYIKKEQRRFEVDRGLDIPTQQSSRES
ncbi:super-infection exclusion protein B [Burkholderia sp. TSV86]|uniref:super-infection exclusion protein B n=1 Tax=Burkholderia sp. TSV86 TaxID=1385594 RepID=UPI000753770D|nr:super-infection exclusion protein B [Burkholderia sp. TSV86]KVE33149.1 hypothetical protein WS68_13685 [Burkholderia sp. TSV86]